MDAERDRTREIRIIQVQNTRSADAAVDKEKPVLEVRLRQGVPGLPDFQVLCDLPDGVHAELTADLNDPALFLVGEKNIIIFYVIGVDMQIRFSKCCLPWKLSTSAFSSSQCSSVISPGV